MENMKLLNWAGIAVGVALMLHALKIYDMTTVPVIGQLLAKFLTPFAPKPIGVPAVLPSVVSTDKLSVEERCSTLLANITALRHYASEQPKEKAVACLDACDVLWAAVEETHKTHTGS